eukprot:3751891-Prorocentrum_lima.AAC.1
MGGNHQPERGAAPPRGGVPVGRGARRTSRVRRNDSGHMHRHWQRQRRLACSTCGAHRDVFLAPGARAPPRQ